MTTDQLNLAIRDSVAMEAAKTYRELEYVCRNIEARHTVEGIGPAEQIAYQNERAKHIMRVARAVLA